MNEDHAQLGEKDADTVPRKPATPHRPGHPRSLWLELGLLLVAGLALLLTPISPALMIAICAAGLAAQMAIMMISRRPVHRRQRLTASTHHQLEQLNETTTQLEEIIARFRSTMEEMRQHPDLALAAHYALQELDNLNPEQRNKACLN